MDVACTETKGTEVNSLYSYVFHMYTMPHPHQNYLKVSQQELQMNQIHPVNRSPRVPPRHIHQHSSQKYPGINGRVGVSAGVGITYFLSEKYCPCPLYI